MSKKQLLVTCDLTTEALALLRSQADLEVSFSKSRHPTPAEIQSAHALIIRSGTRLHKELLTKAKDLEFVVTATSGFDHIDLKTCQERQIRVSHCPEANVESAAQLTLSMILNALRQLPQLHQKVIKNHWRENIKRGKELTGMQLGVIGMGRIGRRVAQLAQAFQMTVVAHDPYVPAKDLQSVGVQPLGLIEVFKTSDIISFHVPLTSETKHMVNHRTLAHFNPEAWIINTSRGAVINETELAVKMRKGLFSGIALDVFEKEPLPKESPLRPQEKIVFSPHVGAYTEQAFAKASRQAAEKVISWFNKGQWTHRLPPEAEWAKYL